MMKMDSCKCDKCVRACKTMPGLFAPGEAEKAAELLGVSFDKFNNRLIKNYLYDLDDPIVLMPRKINTTEEIASDQYTNTKGQCTFLTEVGLCEIHEAKPYECKQSFLCRENKSYWPEINELWKGKSLNVDD